jgi:hypothetical protein
MKRPDNRMEIPENRMPRAAVEPPKEEIEEKPERLPDRERGIACKWCKVVGRNVVRKTYANNIRLRFCQSCRREFMTRETIG